MKRKLFMSVLIVSIFFSCKKHLVEPSERRIPPPEVPARDAWVAGINKEIATILESVYQNDSAYREVNATIFSGYYADETVLLKDLLMPDNSELYQSERFRSFNIPPGVFRRAFYEALAKGDYPLVKAALARETAAEVVPKTLVVASNALSPGNSLTILSGPTATAIYFPYSENFAGSTGISREGSAQRMSLPTLVSADSDADVASGRLPTPCSIGGSRICYRAVIVTDNYAYNSPTHIVQPGAKPAKANIGSVAPGSAPMTKVFLGWARLTRQMDKLFSITGNGGGSEVIVARLSGYLQKKDEQIVAFNGDQVTLDYSRGEIRRQKWKRVYAAWDADWKPDNTEQVFVAYEDDTKGTKTLSGSLNTTITLPGSPSLGKAQGEVSFKLELTTQDDIITQRKLGRATFLRDGLNNQGWGYFNDPTDLVTASRNWPIYDGGTIWQFTLPWKIG